MENAGDFTAGKKNSYQIYLFLIKSELPHDANQTSFQSS